MQDCSFWLVITTDNRIKKKKIKYLWSALTPDLISSLTTSPPRTHMLSLAPCSLAAQHHFLTVPFLFSYLHSFMMAWCDILWTCIFQRCWAMWSSHLTRATNYFTNYYEGPSFDSVNIHSLCAAASSVTESRTCVCVSVHNSLTQLYSNF